MTEHGENLERKMRIRFEADILDELYTDGDDRSEQQE